jgi:uncharacterized protein YxeA
MKRALLIITGVLMLIVGAFFACGVMVSHGTNLLIAVLLGAFFLGVGWEALQKGRKQT